MEFDETATKLHGDLQKLKKVAQQCTNCGLRQGCRGVVFDDGTSSSPVMFVGEGPGQTEDEQGLPFVGKAGQLLNKILEAAGMPRETVYITNIVKCRPPGNRTPTMDEMQTCLPWLRRQFALLRPRFMVLLGLAASHAIISPDLKMGSSHGQWFKRQGLWIMPTYHPAAILRNPNLRRPTWEDFQLISTTVKKYATGEELD